MQIKVGFGPRTGNNSFFQAGELVAAELDKDLRFTCGLFGRDPYSLEELSTFDVIVFIKYFPDLAMLRALKARGKTLILDCHDRAFYPSLYERSIIRKILKKIYLWKTEAYIKKQLRIFDLCFVPSPALMKMAERIGMRAHFLQRQLYNHKNELHFKEPNDKHDSLVLYWTGVGVNQVQNIPILPALKRLHEKYNSKIVYSTDTPGTEDFIEYRTWSRDSWEEELCQADIAFRWHDDSQVQYLKDANKVLAFMGAGLPVVMNPTESEKLVVKDGETGSFASTPQEFEDKMTRLIEDPALRAKIGHAAHDEVWQKYSLKSQVDEIKKILLEVTA